MIQFSALLPIKHPLLNISVPPPFECVFVNKHPYYVSAFDGITGSDVEDAAAESVVIDASETEAIDVE